MRVLGTCKSCNTANRLSLTLKTQANPQSLLTDLRKNLNDKTRFREYVQKVLGDEEHMGSVLDTISATEEDHRLATVTGWFTVNIANCAGVSNSSIFLALKWVLMPVKVEIFNFKRSGLEDQMAHGQFMVDNLLSANRLKRLQEEVAVLYTRQKIEVQVIPGLPKSVMNTQITEGFTTALEAAITTRYELATRTLDLSRFHASPELNFLFCPLHVVKLLESVLILAGHVFPQMTGIVLSNNYLCTLKAFAGIPHNFASLERLDISANRIKDLGELNYLKKLRFKTIYLAGNGLAKLKTDDIREMLPQLQNIHGCVQPEENANVAANLPKFQQFHSGGSNGFQFCCGFISSYYNLFDDTEKRSQLKEFYHDEAMFSLSAPVHLDCVGAYQMYNRNQKRHCSSFARNARLQIGSPAVLLALRRLPSTMTNRQNAGLDIQVFTANLRIFTVTGVFKEITSDGWEPRPFQRTFVLRLLNSPGWLITNDMLCIISAIPEQRKSVRFQPEVTKINSPAVAFVKGLSIKTKAQEKPVRCPSNSEVDPLNQAVENMTLSTSKMESAPSDFDDMPPLVAIAPLSAAPVDSLEQEIENTLVSDEDNFELVIDEDVLIGGHDF
ncbi:nuclear RNA export factor 1 [Drosophila biarmipes]|uniref:nuclear RNA export factor 1 n=1 Tax=Drosophila biarmipes TaxID=125945 RepID=UPI0007E5C109|nr:nuclear RNA export factor 1 [Drosophila biarmipes]